MDNIRYIGERKSVVFNQTMCDDLGIVFADDTLMRYGGVGYMGGGLQAFTGKGNGRRVSRGREAGRVAVCSASCSYRLGNLYHDSHRIPAVFRESDTDRGEGATLSGPALAGRFSVDGREKNACVFSDESTAQGLRSLYGGAGGAVSEGLLEERNCRGNPSLSGRRSDGTLFAGDFCQADVFAGG